MKTAKNLIKSSFTGKEFPPIFRGVSIKFFNWTVRRNVLFLDFFENGPFDLIRKGHYGNSKKECFIKLSRVSFIAAQSILLSFNFSLLIIENYCKEFLNYDRKYNTFFNALFSCTFLILITRKRKIFNNYIDLVNYT